MKIKSCRLVSYVFKYFKTQVPWSSMVIAALGVVFLALLFASVGKEVDKDINGIFAIITALSLGILGSWAAWMTKGCSKLIQVTIWFFALLGTFCYVGYVVGGINGPARLFGLLDQYASANMFNVFTLLTAILLIIGVRYLVKNNYLKKRPNRTNTDEPA